MEGLHLRNESTGGTMITAAERPYCDEGDYREVSVGLISAVVRSFVALASVRYGFAYGIR